MFTFLLHLTCIVLLLIMAATKYIRFGNIPENGKSWNSMDSREEAGVSCYRLVKIGREWRMDGAWGSYMGLRASGRPLFEITGTEIGKGADGEPVLANASTVRKMRDGGWSDCWEKISNEGLMYGERIYRHLVSGDFWFCLRSQEFKCTKDEMASEVRVWAKERAEKILAGLR